ncbi:hypothetical protein ACFQJC_00860 [Haloferax namakaokahaiae]|uniref:Uncharacterized protein n=1 Tax=Haloferax namakaokahaiae TaxID=1748331 RepID=A0ABD5ZA48_9EURY
MADFTLFEVHLHDGFEFRPTNRAPLMSRFSREGDADETDEIEMEEAVEVEIEADEETDDESSSGPGMGLVFGLVLLVGIAAVVRYLRSGGADEEYEELVGLDADEVEASA